MKWSKRKTRRASPKRKGNDAARKLVFQELEPRILYSADAVGGADALLDHANAVELLIEQSVVDERDTESADSQFLTSQIAHEVIFVDTDTDDYQLVVDDLLINSDDTRQFDVIVLDNTRDGIEQISEALASYESLDAVHVISHGNDGSIDLGASRVNYDTLIAKSTEISAWADAFSETGDFLIYGCNLAGGNTGESFVEALTRLTETDVAASDDLTGNLLLGGDWDLEITTGTVETAVAISVDLQSSYRHTLADITSDLLGHWTFDANANNAAGNYNHGSLVGSANIDTSADGGAVGAGGVSLDGLNNYVDLGTPASDIANLTQGTVAAWVKFTDIQVGTIFGITDMTNSGDRAGLRIYDSNVNFYIEDSAIILLDVEINVNINDGQWHHVAVTVDGFGNRMFLDGIEYTGTDLSYYSGNRNSTTFFADVHDGGDLDSMQIGVSRHGFGFANEFDGSIDDVRVYSRALTAEDIAALAGSPQIVDLAGDRLDYASGSGAVVIEQGTDAIASDLDSNNFNGGDLQVSFQAGADNSEDALSIRNQGSGSGEIGVTGSNVLFGGVVIGTFTGGSAGSVLDINFNANATTDALTALLRNITYENTDISDPTTGDRTVRFTLRDGDGNSSGDHDATVAVTKSNTAPTFGIGDGTAITPVAALYDGAVDIAIQPDGKYLVLSAANTASSGQDIDFALTRYNADGSLDLDFGANGVVITAINTDNETVSSMELQADGKIVVAGSYNSGTYQDGIVIRYNSDGSLDTTFDSDGISIVQFSVNGNDAIEDIALDSDGKIVVVGYTSIGGVEDIAVARLNSDGSLDTTFDADGKITITIGFGDDRAYAVALQDTGEIVLSGAISFGTDTDAAIIRLNADGSIDTTFGGGIVAFDFPTNSWDSGNDLEVDSDGNIVVAGTTSNGGLSDSFVIRFTAAGTPDATFGSGGYVVISAGSPYEGINELAIQSDGKIIIAGDAYNGSDNDISIIRLNTDGSLDTSFSADGKVRSDLSGAADSIRALAIDVDGSIVVAGDAGGDTFISRLTASGEFDTSFDAVGHLDGTPSFTEGGAAVILDGDVGVSDVELDALNGGLGNYAGASLTLVRDGGANGDDIFSFTAGNGITYSSGYLIKNSKIIATFDTTSTPGELVITFTDANVQIPTSADVDNILRQILYSNSSDNPPATVKIDWTFSDGNTGSQGGGGALTANGSTTVTIIGVNDAPVLGSFAGGGSYTEGSVLGSLVYSAMTITDVDSSDFNGGILSFTISANGESTDELAIRAQGSGVGEVGVSGNDVTYNFGAGAVTIGSFTGGNGDTNPFVVTFNANSNPASVQAVARQVAFRTISDNPSSDQRTIDVFVTDGDSGTSATYSRTMDVIPENDTPIVSIPANPADYTEQAPPLTLAPALLLTDPDGSDGTNPSNLYNAVIRITGNFDPNDTLGFVDTAKIEGLLVGNQLNLTVKSGQTASIAEFQAAMRSVTFSNSSDNPSALTRTISFAFDDGVDSSVPELINLDVIPVNDLPVIGGVASGSVTEDVGVVAGDLVASATLTITDADTGEDGFVATTINGLYGTFSIDAAGSWAYTADNSQAAIQGLGSGDSVAESFVVASADGSTNTLIAMTIYGTEDASVITGTVVGAVTEGNVGDTPVTATGTLSIVDLDADDTPSFADVGATAGDNAYGSFTLSGGTWTYTLDQSAVQDLDAGDMVNDTITYTATDGTTQQVTVTITGSDDAAVVTGTVVGAVTEGNVGDTPVTATGTLSIVDLDADDTPSFADIGATAGDNAYGSFTLSGGTWTYTLDQSAVQDLDASDMVNDTITYTATDGTTQQVTVTITGSDDAAVVTGTVVGAVTEGNVGDTPVTATGTLSIVDLDADDTPSFADVGATAGDNAYGSFTLSGGTWTYTLDQSAVQDLDAGDMVNDTITYTATDGTTQQVTVTITGSDDAAVVTGTVVGAVTEGNVGDTPVTATGTLSIVDLDADDTPSFADVGATAGDNAYGSFTLSGGTWTYTLDQSAVQDLDAGDMVNDTITYTATDGTTQQVTVTITGSDDAAVVTGTVVGAVTEGNVGDTPVTATGTLSIVDLDADDTPSFADVGATAGDNAYGSFTLSGGTWTYTLDQSAVQDLDAGDMVNDTITYTATDGTTQQVTVTITGSDDAAVVTGTVVGAVTEGNVGDTPVTATGKLSIVDLDADDTPSFADVGATAGDNAYGSFTLSGGTWTYTLDQSAVQDLDAGDMVNDTITYTATDGTTQQVTVTITGSDDAAVVTGTVVGAVTEGNVGDTPVTATGTLSIVDLDADDTPSFADVGATAGDNAYGSFTLSGGTWTYTLDQSAVQDLDAGDMVNDTITYTATDGTTQQVTVTIIGTADAPIAYGIANVAVDEDSPSTLVDLHSLFDDAEDTSAGLAYSVSSNSNVGLFSNVDSSGGSLRLDFSPDAYGNASIVLRATDSQGGFVETTFDVDVAPVNDAPSLVTNNRLEVVEEQAQKISAVTIKAVDIDNTASEIVYILQADPVGGSLQRGDAMLVAGSRFSQADIDQGRISYVAHDDANPSVAFTYRLTDLAGADQGTYSLSVTVLDDGASGDLEDAAGGFTQAELSREREVAGPNPESQDVSVAADAPVPANVPTEVGVVPNIEMPPPVGLDLVSELTFFNAANNNNPPTLNIRQQDTITVESSDRFEYDYRTIVKLVEEVQHAVDKELSRVDHELPDQDRMERVTRVLQVALDTLAADMDEAIESEVSSGRLSMAAGHIGGATMSVGILAWLFRAGSLLASVLSVMPLWTRMDPLPVLLAKNPDRDEDAETDEAEREAAKILDGEET